MDADAGTLWVVYKMANFGAAGKGVNQNAVCTQTEWDAMELARPGRHALIREHIANEGEAERLARDLQTPPAPPPVRRPTYIDLRRAERAARVV